MRTTLLKVGLPLLVALVAVLAICLWYGNGNPSEQKLVESVEKSQYAFYEYFNADYDAAKAAMLEHVLLLDRLSAESDSPSRSPHSQDAIAWFVRLAKLEQRNNGSGSEYMREACLRCEKLGRIDCSEEKLSQYVDGMDTIARSQLEVEPK